MTYYPNLANAPDFQAWESNLEEYLTVDLPNQLYALRVDSAKYAGPILDALCYLVGFRYLGKEFLIRSIAATFCLAGFLKVWESLPFLLPDLTDKPLLAAIAGACCVGIGVGLVVRQEASSGGDDALALVISKLTHCKISRAYLATDLTVLVLSLTYIPVGRIAYSLITVTISSLLIDFVQTFSLADWKKRLAALRGAKTAIGEAEDSANS